MISFRLVLSAHNRLPIARGSTRPGAVGRVLPILAASLALAVGADSAQAAVPDISAASDTLRVTLSAPDGGTVDEGATGHFEVSVAGNTAAGAVTVQYSVSGTALAGEDYTALSGEATVAQGESVARIALEALKDGILDKGETVVLALTGATGPGTLLVDQTAATATIADNGSVTIALAAVSDTIGEGSRWNSAVTMSTPVADRISVRWWTRDGTALAGRDYTAVDEVVSFQPGETSKSISVKTLQDDNTEAVEVFYVSLDLAFDAARAGTEDVLRIDPKPQSAFIECSVRFRLPDPMVLRLDQPVKAGRAIGIVAAETTPGIPYYELKGGDNKFTINSLTAQISTTAALEAGGFYELTVTVHDECGAQASVDVNVIVNGTPTTPTPIPADTVEVGESGSVDASEHFSDPDNDNLTYTAISSKASVVSVSVSGNTVTYTGRAAGSASVTVTATDPGGLSATQSFPVRVNNPPECRPIPFRKVKKGESVQVDLTGLCSDKDGDDLDFENPTSSRSGVATVSLNGSILTINGIARGSATIGATATDPLGASAKAEGSVEVLNDPPECKPIPPQAVEVGKRVTVDLAGLCSDKDGDDLDFKNPTTSKSGVATVSLNGSVLTFTGVSPGGATIGVKADDLNGGTVDTSGPVTVTQPNRGPTVEESIKDRTIAVGESGSVDLSSKFDDPDGDVLTYAAESSEETLVRVGMAGSTVTYEGLAAGSATVTVTATDPGGLSAAQGFSVTVNGAPECRRIPAQEVDRGKSVTVNLARLCTDPNGDDLDFGDASTSDAGVATVSLAGSVLKITGVARGSATVGATASDPLGESATVEGPVTVPNSSPECRAIPRKTLDAGESVTINLADLCTDPDKDQLSYSGAKSTDDGVAKVSLTGSKLTITGVAEGSATARATATDPPGASATASGSVVVEEGNQPPDADAGSNQTVEEYDRVTLDGSGSRDRDGRIVRWEWTGPVSLSGATTAKATFDAPSVDTETDYTFTLKVWDDDDATDTDRVRITVKPIVCADPTANAGADVTERELRRVTLSAARSRNASSYAWKQVGGRTVTLSGANTATPSFDTPLVSANAVLTFRLTTTSACGATNTDDVRVTVRDNRTPKTAGAIPAQPVLKGYSGTVSVSGYFTDADGDALTYTAASAATGVASVSVTGSKVKYTGKAVGSARVTVTAKDEYGATAKQEFRVTVSDPPPTNDAPEIASAIPPQAVVAGGTEPVRVSSHFSDPDNDALTYSATSSNRNAATVSVRADTVFVRGVAKGTADVTVTARDPSNATVAQKFRVTVSDPPPTNDAPEIESAIPARTVVAGDSAAVVVSPHFSDPEGDALTYSAGSSNRDVAMVSVSSDTVWVRGVSKGTADVTVTARDPHGAEVSQGFRVTVKAGNAAPEVASAIPALTVAAGETAVVDVSGHFRDPDDDALTYEAMSSNEAAATVKASGSDVTVTGVFRGESQVTVTARDGRGGSVSQAFAVTVPNGAPEAVGAIAALTVAKGDTGSVSVSGRFTDPEGDALTYAATSSDGGVLAVDVDGDRVSYEALKAGSAEVTVTADDGHGGTAAQKFGVTVGPDNEAPEVVSAIPALTVAAGETAVVDVSAHFSDPDDDALTYEAESSNEGAATVAVGGSEVTVTGVLHGESRVTVTARDGRGGSASQHFAVTVPNRPPEPVGSLDRAVAYRGVTTTVEVSGAFDDPDGDALTYSASASVDGVVTVRVSGSRVTLQGSSRKSTTVTVTADDGHGGTAQQAFEVEVANHPPVAVGRIQPRTIAAGERFTVTLSDYFRDTDGDTLTYAGAAPDTTVADVSVEGVELVVVGESRGRVVVTAKAHDGHGGTGLQWFVVTVTNGAPVFGADAYERAVAENSAAGTAVGDPVTATDGDGDDLAYGFISGGDEALFGIDAASGQISVAEGAALDHEGESNSHVVQVVASDGTRADTAAVTIRVTDVPAPGRPDAPVVTGGTEEVAVSWSAPANEGPEITNYDLRYRAKADSEWTDVSALGAVLARTITGLEAGTAYQVQVRAESSEGAGAWSEPGEGTTETANRAPSFDAAAYERSVPENSAAGTAVGEPVTATDDDGDDLAYSFLPGGDEALFTIDAASGQIAVAEGAALDHEGESNSHVVQVVASDGTRADTAAVTIRVTDVPAPGKPDAPVVTGGTEEVAVTWSAPENEGPEITNYDLRHRAKADSEWTDVSALGAVLARTITGLEAGTAYQVQVRAESSEGAGAWSEPGEGTTETANEAPSFDAAAYERSVPENSAAGTAVGEPVTAIDDDGDDVAYSFLAGGDEALFTIDAASGQIAVAEGAALDHEGESNSHVVQVVASDGTRADTAAVTIRVTDVPAPGRPNAPVVTGGTEEVAVSWSAPENEGPAITGYDLRYRAKAAAEWTDVSALGAVSAYTITDLNGGTTYQVQVRAISSEGAGEWSEPGEGTAKTANRAPSFDADAYERLVPENSAAGTAVGAPVTATDGDGDDLAYSFLAGGDEASFAINAVSGQIAVAEGAALDYESGNTAYTVSVRASDGTRADTAVVTIRVTDVPAPGKPDAPVVKGGAGQVAVSWSAPANQGPAITGYKIRHRTKSGGEWTAPTALGAVLAQAITGLEAGTAYLVQVRAISSEGAGEWSEPGEGTTDAPANRAPSFDAETYEREVPENSPAGTAVGEPVTATDDGDELSYRFMTGGEAPFEIDAATGRITVAEGAALNYESGETQFTVRVEASDGELADIASVTIRVTNADEDGVLTLSPEVARVGVELTATLTDEDGVRGAGRNRKWQRSADGTSWNDIGTGRMYNPVTADAGRWLRAVFTYADGHGPGKRAVSEPVKVLAANAAPAFEADAYEREVPENSEGGTKIGRPVRATDADGDELVYGIVGGGDDAPFEIHATTGRIKVAVGAALNYESGDTLYTVRVEASDGELADTASVAIRVTDADDPGEVALAPEVARVGVELTADLTDEDGAHGAGRKRKWQRSADGNSWNDIASGRRYTPVTTDEGRWLRAVFEYTDGHGPDKRAVSEGVKVLAANAAPSFAAVYEREVPENSPGGTRVGAPVAATDPDNTSLSYSFASAGDEALFEIGAATGQITVADGAALDYESGDTLLAVRVEASDGELADTASVTIRMTNADDPGKITLSADVARVGVRLTATLMDQDRSVERSKMRTWQRSSDGAAWTMVVQGAARRFYTPTAADRGQYLRAVFTYTDGHGPGKRAESAAVAVVGASTPVVSFGADSYTAAPGGSADVGVLLSPAASSALAIEVAAGGSTYTVTFQPGASSATVAVGTAGLSASDTLAVRFGTLPDGVAVGVPATTRIIVAAAAGDRASRSVVEDGSPVELEVEYAQAEYSAVAGGPVTEVTLWVSPAADRRVAVPLTAAYAASLEPALPDSVVFEPGDSLAAFMLDVPAGTTPGLLALGLGTLPEAVSAGTVASATVDIAAGDAGALRDEAFELGLAVFGRAVAEGARQAVGARIDAVMRPDRGGSGTPIPGSAAEWAGSAAGTLASLAGLPLGASSSADMARRRSGSLELPTGREVAGRLLPRVSFATALGAQAAQGRLRFGLWAEGSTQSFRGEPGIDYDGGLRALTVGADARIGSSGLLGVSLMRSDGDLDYGNRAIDGSLGHAMNSIHPYLFLQPSPRIGLWAMAGYGSGDVRDDDRHGDTGAALRMLAGGVKVPLARRGAFGLALTGDAFTVGMRADDGGREGSASRARALLEASWTASGLKLATQAGARYDGGDADTGGGAETGASIGYAGHGLDLDLRGRLALGSGSHREWGAALRLAFDPGTRGEGFRLAISPGHGRDQSGIHGLMDGRALQAMPTATPGRQWRLDAEAGYALKNPGGGGALDCYTRLSSHGRNRSLSFGTRYGVNQLLRLGIEGSRSQLPGQDPNLGLRLALDFTF